MPQFMESRCVEVLYELLANDSMLFFKATKNEAGSVLGLPKKYEC